MPSAYDVEGHDMVRSLDVEAAWLLVRAAVGDVEDSLVRREGDAVRLVEAVVDDVDRPGDWVPAVDVVTSDRLRPEALEVAVGRSVNQTDPSLRTTTSLGRVQRKVPPASTITDTAPVDRSTRLIRARRV